MKFPHHNNDHPVQVWREERQVLPQYAHFYQGIFNTKVKEFECIKFILANIAPIEEKRRAEKERGARSILRMYQKNKPAATNQPQLVAA